MRPYLAILKDSFREAISSRVLLLMIGLSTLALAALAPISLNERRVAYLERSDIDQPELLAIQLSQAAKIAAIGGKQKESPARRVWDRLDSWDQEALGRLPMDRKADNYPAWQIRSLYDTLNDLLDDATFYDAEVWAGLPLSEEAKELAERGPEELSQDELARLNRLLLEAAFRRHIRESFGTALHVGYFYYEHPSPFPTIMSRRAIVALAVSTFTDWVLGFLGVFVAILVTASIIPHTFEPGAVDLLLSKPVGRIPLFLTKFVGGCAFVAVTAGYLIVGLWLLIGLRFDWWHHRLLWCIPLLLFLFAIYYGVSALAGLIWRNTIVCVVMTIVLWFVCAVMGLVKLGFDSAAMEPSRIQAIVPAGDTLVATNPAGRSQVWDDGEWKDILQGSGETRGNPWFFAGPSRVGPVYDPKTDRLLLVDELSGESSIGGSGKVLYVGQREEGWKKVAGPDVPSGVSKVFVRGDGRIVLTGTEGIHLLEAPADRRSGGRVPLGDWGSFKIPFINDAFRRVSPDDWPPSVLLDMDRASGTIAVWDGEKLGTLAPGEHGRYTWRKREPKARGPANERGSRVAALAFAGSTILTALFDGTIVVFDAATLEQRAEYPSPQSDEVREIVASPDGRYFAVLHHDRRIWLYDAQADAAVSLPISHQGDVSAAAFLDGDRLAVAHSFNSVSEYSLESAAPIETREPALGTAERVYWYFVKPVYTIFPKPSELKNLVHYVLTGKETVTWGDDGDRRNPNAYHKFDVWGPLWSNAAFLAVMLGLGSLYIYRREF